MMAAGHLWQAPVHVLEQAADCGLVKVHDDHLAGLPLQAERQTLKPKALISCPTLPLTLNPKSILP